MHVFTSIAHLMTVAVAVGVSLIVYLRLIVFPMKHDYEIELVAQLAAVLTMFFTGLGLKLIRRNLSPSMKSTILWKDVLFTCSVVVILVLVLFFLIMSMGLGLTILVPFLGWLSTLQEGLVLIALYAGFSAYVVLLASLALIYPFLFSLQFNKISTYELP
ncbi:hypothetical protein Mal35_07360 [Gimesia maris]|uniref:hypothetical protein n=1 Tax=Gimesia maris TaxID=122 RepID=UPI001187CA9E|nr:hypothetical protein [Gimesia maris]QDT77310.1 hypothetical protein Mal35_07360 [Gimesia maris]